MTHYPTSKIILKKPPWLKRSLPSGPEQEAVRALLRKGRLNTVCQEAKCPNLWECFSQKTATFLIMGSRCTRNCGFCAVSHGPVSPPDMEEPIRVAEAVQQMQLSYVVITSVTRDDLSDGGASYFSATIHEIRKKISDILVEVLIPDFQGNEASIQSIVDAQPDILNHNLETVPRLYNSVRPQAGYRRSLELLKHVHLYDPDLPTKSGLMLGLGEKPEEIQETLKDLLDVGCRILTLGQYLQPSAQHLPVYRFVPPEEFDIWRKKALEIGFSKVASGPFIRSSYHAKTLFQAL